MKGIVSLKTKKGLPKFLGANSLCFFFFYFPSPVARTSKRLFWIIGVDIVFRSL